MFLPKQNNVKTGEPFVTPDFEGRKSAAFGGKM
jgi:hypothetical protein